MNYITPTILVAVIVIAHTVAIRSLSYDMTDRVPVIALINDHASWFMKLTVSPVTINFYATLTSFFATLALMGVVAKNWRTYVRDIQRGVVRAEVLMRLA